MYSTQDLIITRDFTLPENATRAQLERALALISGLKEIAVLPNGRVIFSKSEVNYVNKYVVLADDDNRSREAKISACKEVGASIIFDPFVDPIIAKMVIGKQFTIAPNIGGSQGLVGSWSLSTRPASTSRFDIQSANIAADEIYVQETFKGYNIRETACRAALGLVDRYKDVYYYYSEKLNGFRIIALSEEQKQFLILRSSLEDFHRRLIWFPHLTQYVYALLHTGSVPLNAEKLARLEEKARKALDDRKQYKRDELFDFLDNYYYKDKGVFDKSRLKTGVIYAAS
ncbi:hypothetical protein NGK36_21630 [Hafnia alvei]|uniref:hypothetical protein n=1 Tax=Hafnia alvei TaxID=569 RepID=UPI002DB9A4A0|nr:hypothetical protein [Hafnia alvei]MEB7891863.1 hypothetical protein [Hafnia alvei]